MSHDTDDPDTAPDVARARRSRALSVGIPSVLAVVGLAALPFVLVDDDAGGELRTTPAAATDGDPSRADRDRVFGQVEATTGTLPGRDGPVLAPIATTTVAPTTTAPAPSTTFRTTTPSTTQSTTTSTIPPSATTTPPTTTPPATTPPTTTPPATTTAPAPVAPSEPLRPVDPPSDPHGHEEQIALGRMSIPAIGLDAPLLEGIRLPTLDAGPGHWPGTAMPGQIGNVVVAAHRTSEQAHFRHVDRLVPGDEVRFDVDGRSIPYRVTSTEIVQPDAMWIVDQTDTATATLFACHPPGSVSQRIVVHLELAG
ncbi:sortase [Ilumatobacter sp.]|uniref:sortase n=1 Tax=Ilumatobacter sp. TaxID=1967498 RepID=UPI003B51F863